MSNKLELSPLQKFILKLKDFSKDLTQGVKVSNKDLTQVVKVSNKDLTQGAKKQGIG
ncbi:MAG: hypothetical protein KAU06_03810 [Candidatus Marinimicrobia bacterium]|nr:hypothetical protein [Candidatus Neomarinimicrobiota bacterium]